MSGEDKAEILASLDGIPVENAREQARERVEARLKPLAPPWPGIVDITVDRLVLLDKPEDSRWRAFPQDKKTADEAAYDRELSPFLAELAETDEFVAQGIARRFPDWSSDEAERNRLLWPDLARRLLDGWAECRIKLSDDMAANLEKIAAPRPADAPPLRPCATAARAP